MSQISQIRLASVLCSRLCHDLISPVGAISNGLEIMNEEEDAGMRDEAVAIMTRSAEEAGRRLAFFRLAFGAAGGMAEAVSSSELRHLAEGWIGQGRLRLEWMPDPAAVLDKAHAKLLLNMLMVAAAMLPKGGTIEVQVSGAPDVTLRVGAVGPGVRLAPETKGVLAGAGGDTAMDAHNVVAHLTHLLTSELGGTAALSESSERIALTIAIPARIAAEG